MMNHLALYELSDSLVDSCVDLFIETFSGKPWINGMEYYIDQFGVKVDMQGQGIGSQFLK